MYRLLTYHTTKTEICLPFFFFLKRSLTSENFFLFYFLSNRRDRLPTTDWNHTSSVFYDELNEEKLFTKNMKKKKLLRRSPRRGVVLLGLGERRNERKLRISLTWLFCSSSWLLLLINAKRENYYINYSTTRRDFFSIFLTSKALSNSTL